MQVSPISQNSTTFNGKVYGMNTLGYEYSKAGRAQLSKYVNNIKNELASKTSVFYDLRREATGNPGFYRIIGQRTAYNPQLNVPVTKEVKSSPLLYNCGSVENQEMEDLFFSGYKKKKGFFNKLFGTSIYEKKYDAQSGKKIDNELIEQNIVDAYQRIQEKPKKDFSFSKLYEEIGDLKLSSRKLIKLKNKLETSFYAYNYPQGQLKKIFDKKMSKLFDYEIKAAKRREV